MQQNYIQTDLHQQGPAFKGFQVIILNVLLTIFEELALATNIDRTALQDRRND